MTLIAGRGELVDDVPGMAAHTVKVTAHDGTVSKLTADVVLVATGASPRVLPDAEPDGERILTWRQVYDLDELPEQLVVVGSGVTGAEFVNAYTELGVDGHLVSSRDRVLPQRGRRRRRGDRGRVRRPRHEAGQQRPGRVGEPRRRRRGGHPGGRPHGRGQPRLMTGRLGAQHRGLGLERVGVELGAGGYVDGGPGVAHAVPGDLRGR